MAIVCFLPSRKVSRFATVGLWVPKMATGTCLTTPSDTSPGGELDGGEQEEGVCVHGLCTESCLQCHRSDCIPRRSLQLQRVPPQAAKEGVLG